MAGPDRAELLHGRGPFSDEDWLDVAVVQDCVAALIVSVEPECAAAASAPPAQLDMYEPVTAEASRANVCGHLLTILSMAALSPERTSLITAMAPHAAFTTQYSVG